MHEVGLTNASRLDKISGFQAFRPRCEGSSIAKPLIGDLNDPLGIAMGAEHTIRLSKEIDSNPTRKCGMAPTRKIK